MSKQFQVSRGQLEDGVVVGNAFDKYGSSNPIVNWIMKGFDDNLQELVSRAGAASIHEVGCGEGFWTIRWHQEGRTVRGSDFSGEVIELARGNARSAGVEEDLFSVRSVYELDAADTADLLVCCEVLEHLEEPERALARLADLVSNHVIFSVPREPLWCALNLARGKYVSRLGNTPGHLQHWSSRGFVALISRYFDILEVRRPLPWTMLLARQRA